MSLVFAFRYGVMIPILNFLTSMLGGFAVFAIVGYLAHQSGVPPEQVVAQGVYRVLVVAVRV